MSGPAIHGSSHPAEDEGVPHQTAAEHPHAGLVMSPDEHRQRHDEQRVGLHVEAGPEIAGHPAAARQPSIDAVQHGGGQSDCQCGCGHARCLGLADESSCQRHQPRADDGDEIGRPKPRKRVLIDEGERHRDRRRDDRRGLPRVHCTGMEPGPGDESGAGHDQASDRARADEACMERAAPHARHCNCPQTATECVGVREEALAFWVAAPGRGEIRSEVLPSRSDGDVLIRTLYSGISRGTEALVFNGRVPDTERTRMRAPFQAGDFPSPVKYGYASVGRVERGPSGLQGRTVFVLHPHQTRYVVPESAVHVLPDGVPAERAVLTANLETAINGVWDGRPHVGDRITVIGAGTVGCLVAWLAARIAGCAVELVDINPNRAVVARALGVRFAEPASAAQDADVVFHASGSPAGLDLALHVAGFETRIVELSWFGDQTVALPLGGAFHAKRLAITASQVGSVAVSQRARWDTRRRMQLALSLLKDPSLDALITGESSFETLPEVMQTLATSPGETLCHRVRYWSPDS